MNIKSLVAVISAFSSVCAAEGSCKECNDRGFKYGGN